MNNVTGKQFFLFKLPSEVDKLHTAKVLQANINRSNVGREDITENNKEMENEKIKATEVKQFFYNEHVVYWNQKGELTKGWFIREKQNKIVLRAVNGEYEDIEKEKIFKEKEPIMM